VGSWRFFVGAWGIPRSAPRAPSAGPRRAIAARSGLRR